MLQQALDDLISRLNTDAQTEPDLLQELEAASTPAGGSTQPTAASRTAAALPRAAPAAAVPRAPPSTGAAVTASDVAALREELRALKREIVALRDAGKTAEAKAGMPRLRELERKIAESLSG
jgi:ribosomal protein L29